MRWKYRLFTIQQLFTIRENWISGWLRPVFVSLFYCESILEICVSTSQAYAIKFWTKFNFPIQYWALNIEYWKRQY